ncbi:E1-E2 ATPase-associated domain-containing protein [Nitritalea halalkaliphila LW7]|uniref:E1-E2 ATPase-associated domain-containing protein n=1 Tax=Nitritalea halalkaliphila LW7 TaxID=1189621 RepID=I5C467_9BACT|nr:E1-E2 ATPase-associated domain-containing protein [Nitritalea halalkaliphila LW7]
MLATHKGSMYRLGSASFTGLPQALRQGFTGNQVVFAQDDRIIGYFLLHSGLRQGMEAMIGSLSADYPVHLLSGDQDHERTSMAQRLGSEVQLNFRQSPQDKLDYLEKLRAAGQHALMIGDGLNDAGALKAAHVGIALTDQASHFSPASDAILDASMLEQLPRFFRFSRQSRNVIKASFGLSFTYNAFGVYFAVQGLISPLFCAILMPISSLSVVLFTTLATNYLAHRQGLSLKPTVSWK